MEIGNQMQSHKKEEIGNQMQSHKKETNSELIY